MSLAGTLLAGRRLPVSDVDVALIVAGLNMLSDRIEAEINEARARGLRSTTHEQLLVIINGGRWTPEGTQDETSSKGLIARVTGGHEVTQGILKPGWEPIQPEGSADDGTRP